MELAEGELDYLRAHWPLLGKLTRALRTEPNVSLAVVYGSVARGDDRADSDIDLLVALRDDAPQATEALSVRLERALGRGVDVTRVDRAEAQAPLLMLSALDEGRVIVDRGARWPGLQARRGRVRRAAERAQQQARREAAESLRMLLEGES